MITVKLVHDVIEQSFGRAATHYDAAAVLQYEVGGRLIEQLNWLRHDQPANLVDLGAGTGYLTKQLQQRYPQANTIAVDLAQDMLHYARQHHLNNTLTHCICANASQLPLLHHSIELIFSNLMMQWCNDLPSVFAEIQRVLKPGGMFLFSTFGPDTLFELRDSWSKVDDYPHTNHFLDLHAIGDLLLAGHWKDPVVNTEKITLHYSTVKQALSDLRHVGVKNTRNDRQTGLTGRKKWQSFLEHYENYRTAEGQLPLTYDIIYGHALAPQEDNSVPINQLTWLRS